MIKYKELFYGNYTGVHKNDYENTKMRFCRKGRMKTFVYSTNTQVTSVCLVLSMVLEIQPRNWTILPAPCLIKELPYC